MSLNLPPRKPLGFFPTPLIEAKRLSACLGGPRIWIKRDDHTGLALGGNKVRKLEFLIGDAISCGYDCLITGGAAQSNHCRQTAAAAAASGLECHLALGGEARGLPSGNLLLDYLFGAKIHWAGEYRKGETIDDISQELKRHGRKPYIVPYGGSNTIGATGFVEATKELATQLNKMQETISHVVFPSSSGGTQAGLIVGKRVYSQDYQIIGIGIDKEDQGQTDHKEQIHELAKASASKIGADSDIPRDDVDIRQDYWGSGYGVVRDAERQAIKLLAETEGLLLDPVYTGRAMAGLIDLVKSGELSSEDRVLFWHTGGTPALFSYAQDLVTDW